MNLSERRQPLNQLAGSLAVYCSFNQNSRKGSTAKFVQGSYVFWTDPVGTVFQTELNYAIILVK